jgi:hypothetical protein
MGLHGLLQGYLHLYLLVVVYPISRFVTRWDVVTDLGDAGVYIVFKPIRFQYCGIYRSDMLDIVFRQFYVLNSSQINPLTSEFLNVALSTVIYNFYIFERTQVQQASFHSVMNVIR